MSQQFILDGVSLVDIFTFGVQNALDFTQVFKIIANGNIEGYLAVNETPKVKTGVYFNEYIGLFYCNSNGLGLPDGIWTALDINNAANDWGWNQASPPCANINGATLTENNELYIGKQGNIYKSKNSITASNSYFWQQIYTAETTSYDPTCVAATAYQHKGYVNTALTGIFPQTTNMLWDTQYDRLMWYDSGTEKSFIQVTPQSTAPCNNFVITTSCTTSSSPISDAFFVKEYSNELYAGVAEIPARREMVTY